MSNSERIVKGILGTKLGMTQLWDENNKIVPVTVIQAGPCVVTQVRTPEKDGYSAVQLGFGAIASRKVTKPAQGHFDKAGVTPRRHLLELRTANASEFTLGQELTAELFAGGEFVDVTGTTKGKGTAGVMKRHGFGGLKGSHGVHRKHRAPGSIGGCSTPGRVFKGLRMAGRMGNAKVTVQNLKIHALVDECLRHVQVPGVQVLGVLGVGDGRGHHLVHGLRGRLGGEPQGGECLGDVHAADQIHHTTHLHRAHPDVTRDGVGAGTITEQGLATGAVAVFVAHRFVSPILARLSGDGLSCLPSRAPGRCAWGRTRPACDRSWPR